VVHSLHLRDSHGQRRLWHSGHVLMALGMAFMFAPPSLDQFEIPAAVWQLLFANAALAIVVWLLVQGLEGRAVNVLWLAIAVDLGAMAYMFSPSGFVAPLTWVLVAYFVLQALLWASDRMREVDHLALFGGRLSLGSATPAVVLSPGSAPVALSAAEPLVCFRDLRLSMATMTLGMAYMLAAMQLAL
jgi:multidrug transporter EmrE-like cation transporter